MNIQQHFQNLVSKTADSGGDSNALIQQREKLFNDKIAPAIKAKNGNATDLANAKKNWTAQTDKAMRSAGLIPAIGQSQSSFAKDQRAERRIQEAARTGSTIPILKETAQTTAETIGNAFGQGVGSMIESTAGFINDIGENEKNSTSAQISKYGKGLREDYEGSASTIQKDMQAGKHGKAAQLSVGAVQSVPAMALPAGTGWIGRLGAAKALPVSMAKAAPWIGAGAGVAAGHTQNYGDVRRQSTEQLQKDFPNWQSLQNNPEFQQRVKAAYDNGMDLNQARVQAHEQMLDEQSENYSDKAALAMTAVDFIAPSEAVIGSGLMKAGVGGRLGQALIGTPNSKLIQRELSDVPRTGISRLIPDISMAGNKAAAKMVGKQFLEEGLQGGIGDYAGQAASADMGGSAVNWGKVGQSFIDEGIMGAVMGGGMQSMSGNTAHGQAKAIANDIRNQTNKLRQEEQAARAEFADAQAKGDQAAMQSAKEYMQGVQANAAKIKAMYDQHGIEAPYFVDSRAKLHEQNVKAQAEADAQADIQTEAIPPEEPAPTPEAEPLRLTPQQGMSNLDQDMIQSVSDGKIDLAEAQTIQADPLRLEIYKLASSGDLESAHNVVMNASALGNLDLDQSNELIDSIQRYAGVKPKKTLSSIVNTHVGQQVNTTALDQNGQPQLTDFDYQPSASGIVPDDGSMAEFNDTTPTSPSEGYQQVMQSTQDADLPLPDEDQGDFEGVPPVIEQPTPVIQPTEPVAPQAPDFSQPKTFSNAVRARDYIQKNGLKDSHEVITSPEGQTQVQPKQAATPDTPIQPIPPVDMPQVEPAPAVKPVDMPSPPAPDIKPIDLPQSMQQPEGNLSFADQIRDAHQNNPNGKAKLINDEIANGRPRAEVLAEVADVVKSMEKPTVQSEVKTEPQAEAKPVSTFDAFNQAVERRKNAVTDEEIKQADEEVARTGEAHTQHQVDSMRKHQESQQKTEVKKASVPESKDEESVQPKSSQMQDGDIGRKNDNQPFANKGAANLQLKLRNLEQSHEVIKVAPSQFVLREKSKPEESSVSDKPTVQEPGGKADTSTDLPPAVPESEKFSEKGKKDYPEMVELDNAYQYIKQLYTAYMNQNKRPQDGEIALRFPMVTSINAADIMVSYNPDYEPSLVFRNHAAKRIGQDYWRENTRLHDQTIELDIDTSLDPEAALNDALDRLATSDQLGKGALKGYVDAFRRGVNLNDKWLPLPELQSKKPSEENNRNPEDQAAFEKRIAEAEATNNLPQPEVFSPEARQSNPEAETQKEKTYADLTPSQKRQKALMAAKMALKKLNGLDDNIISKEGDVLVTQGGQTIRFKIAVNEHGEIEFIGKQASTSNITPEEVEENGLDVAMQNRMNYIQEKNFGKPEAKTGDLEFPSNDVKNAFGGVHLTPSNTARSMKESYERFIKDTQGKAQALVQTEAQQQALDKAMQTLKHEYINVHLPVLLRAASAAVSSAVAGRANFNVKQADKRGDALTRAQQNFDAQVEYEASKVIKAVRDARTPDQKAADIQAAKEKAEAEQQAKAQKAIDQAAAEATAKENKPKPKRASNANIGSREEADKEMTMAQWQKLGKDYRSIHDGVRMTTVLKNGATILGSVWITDEKGSTESAKPEAEPAPEATSTQPEAKGEKSYETIRQTFDAVQRQLYDGEEGVKIEDVRQAFDDLYNNQDALREGLSKLTKPKLLELLNPWSAERYKSEKKDRIIDKAVQDTFTGMHFSNNGLISISYGENKTFADKVKEGLDQATQADLDKELTRQREKKAEYYAEVERRKNGLDNPQTLDDFERKQRLSEHNTFIDFYRSLPEEQQVLYDELKSHKNNEERLRQIEQNKAYQASKSPSQAVNTSTEATLYAGKHTKKGHDIWTVQLNGRVDGDRFSEIRDLSKSMGGYYSNYKGNGAVQGFVFSNEQSANEFLAELSGTENQDSGDLQEDTLPVDPNAELEVVETDASKHAQKLREKAQVIIDRGNDSLNRDRKTNTHKRAGEARRAEEQANNQVFLGETMNRIANGIENGTVQHLRRISAMTQLRELESILQRGSYDQQHATKAKEREINAGTIAYLDFPQYKLSLDNWHSIWRDLQAVRPKLANELLDIMSGYQNSHYRQWLMQKNDLGTKNYLSVIGYTSDGKIAQFKTNIDRAKAMAKKANTGLEVPKFQVLKIKDGEYAVVDSFQKSLESEKWQPSNSAKQMILSTELGDQIFNALKHTKSVNWVIEMKHDQSKRMRSLDIHDPSTFRAMMREYMTLRSEEKTIDPVKEMERSMVGRSNDGLDFFPTPKPIVEQMIELADLKPSMKVLEPSAGMGHIADILKDYGVEPDVIELSGKRQELLKLKGYNVVGNDFLMFNPDQQENPIKYDRIIMNPPFSDRRDAQHIYHAFDLLGDDGVMVAIAGEGVFFGSDAKAKEFQSWLDHVGAEVTPLDAGTFNDPNLPATTNAKARIITINKADSQGKQFSRREELPEPWQKEQSSTTGTTVDQVEQAIIAKFGQDVFDGLKKKGLMQIIPTYQEKGVEGFAENGTVTLVADHLTGQSIIPTFLHELGGHVGFQGVLSQNAYKNLMQDFDRLVAQKDPIALEAKRLAERESDSQVQKDEYLPYLVTVAAKQQARAPALQRLLNRVLSAVKAWAVGKLGLDLKLNANDILALSERMVKEIAKQGMAKQDSALHASRNKRNIFGGDIVGLWSLFAHDDNAFQLATTDKKNLVDIFKELEDLDVQTMSDSSARFADVDKYWRVKMPTKGTASIYQKNDSVWIDVSTLKQGNDGKRVYNAVANYAHNNGLVFIGDPSGLSDTAMTRRLENMISSALKFGTTEHLYPHERQLEGNELVSALDWEIGNHEHNIKQMILASYEATKRLYPEIEHITYNPEKDIFEGVPSGRFNNGATGGKHQEFTRRDFQKLARLARTMPDGRGSGLTPSAGSTTLERAILTQTILRAKSSQVRREILDRFSVFGSERLTGYNAILYSKVDNSRRYSRTSTGNPSQQPKSKQRELFEQASQTAMGQFALRNLERTKTVSGRTASLFNTMLHKALTDKSGQFKRTFDLVQDKINHVTFSSSKSMDVAPSILTQLEQGSDYLKEIKRVGRSIGHELNKNIDKAKIDRDLEKVGNFMFENTLLEDSERHTDKQLRQLRFDEDQIKLYNEVRDAIDSSLDTFANTTFSNIYKHLGGTTEEVLALAGQNLELHQHYNEVLKLVDKLTKNDPDKATARQTAIESMDKVMKKAESLKEQGYVPLMRFGKYFYRIYNPTTGDVAFRQHFDSESERNMAERKVDLNKIPAGYKLEVGQINELQHKLFQGVSPETVALFAKEAGIPLNGAESEYIKLALKNNHAMKRLLKRQGIDGFSLDMKRVLSAFVLSNARYAANQTYNPAIDESITKIEDPAYQEDAVRLRDYALDTQEELAGMKNFAFVWYMGFSAMFGVVNLTQPLLQTLPYLMQYSKDYGVTSKAFIKAIKTWAKGTGAMDAKYQQYYERARKEGHLDPQNTWMLQGMERGKSGLGASSWQLVSHSAGLFAQASETVNRRTTLFAALDVAESLGQAKLQKLGFKDAYDFAIRTIQETQGIYNKGNRPRVARGNVGSILMMYKQFMLSYIEQMVRMQKAGLYGGEDDEFKKRMAALVGFGVSKAVLLMLGTLFAFSGFTGLPFVRDALDVIETAGGMIGKPVNTEREIQVALHDALGEALGGAVNTVFMDGIANLNPVIDVKGRMGMGDLIPATGYFSPTTSEYQKGSEISQIGGAMGGLVDKFSEAVSLAQVGSYGMAAVQLAPKALTSLGQGANAAVTGDYRNTKTGVKTNDATVMQGVVKMLDAQPSQIAKEGRIRGLEMKDKAVRDYLNKRWKDKFENALDSGDPEQLAKVKADIEQYNKDNPRYPITFNQKRAVTNFEKSNQSWQEKRKNVKGYEWMDQYNPYLGEEAS